ncbi:MAG: class I SAM-dependent methyltransferase [bacterium]|nr:class I SAM-dependent methyltransferase [bacterium]
MPTSDDLAERNQRLWDAEAESGAHYSTPWLDLDRESLQAFVTGQDDGVLTDHAWLHPRRAFDNTEGKDVLCLASGGGQQSAVYGLLGSRVTVLDLSNGQLEGDRKAADHYGYDVRIEQGDMRDLSRFDPDSFDIVNQPVSICFVPDVRDVYREVFRVLRPGGRYAVSHCDPATYPECFDGPDNGWDGVGYRISEPYCGGPIRRRPDGAETMGEGEPTGEHRHLLTDIFNGLVESGFIIQGVWEDPRHIRHDPSAVPGTDAHANTVVARYFTVLAEKRCA